MGYSYDRTAGRKQEPTLEEGKFYESNRKRGYFFYAEKPMVNGRGFNGVFSSDPDRLLRGGMKHSEGKDWTEVPEAKLPHGLAKALKEAPGRPR